jgi:hypothetical protein
MTISTDEPNEKQRPFGGVCVKEETHEGLSMGGDIFWAGRERSRKRLRQNILEEDSTSRQPPPPRPPSIHFLKQKEK